MSEIRNAASREHLLASRERKRPEDVFLRSLTLPARLCVKRPYLAPSISLSNGIIASAQIS
jgi:hypothetical protein